MKVSFSIWNEGTLITEYNLDIEESKIEQTTIDCSSIWDEYTVVVEWPGGNHKVIEPYTYSAGVLNGDVSYE